MVCLGKKAILTRVVEFDMLSLSTQEPLGWVMLRKGLFFVVAVFLVDMVVFLGG
jgi:hypothetical protein